MLIYLLIVLIILLLVSTVYFAYVKPRKDPLNRASELSRQNKLPEAIEEYKRILITKPDTFSIHNIVADLYIKMENYEQAIFHLNEILRIDQFNAEVNKTSVYSRLAKIHYMMGDAEQAFQTYLNLLRADPEDPEALYHISFIALGQEEFDLAQRYFDKLIKVNDNFESFFGAGISCFQNNKFREAAEHFREALAIKPDSDITLLAISFALWKNSRFNEAVSYLTKLTKRTNDDNVLFISKRLLAFMYFLAGKNEEGLQLSEDLLNFVREKKFDDEIKICLYDIGFANVKNEQLELALRHWDELDKLDKSYKNTRELMDVVRRDIDRTKSIDGFDTTIHDFVDDWESKIFPQNFLWNLCGLKSEQIIDIRNILTLARVSRGREPAREDDTASDTDFMDRINKFQEINTKDFKVICNKLVIKLGIKIDEILHTYKDSDGVDMLGRLQESNEKTLIWIRRWKGSNVGEITLRNFAQAINDIKAQKGYFITTADLTPPALNSLKKLSKVKVIYPQDLSNILRGII